MAISHKKLEQGQERLNEALKDMAQLAEDNPLATKLGSHEAHPHQPVSPGFQKGADEEV